MTSKRNRMNQAVRSIARTAGTPRVSPGERLVLSMMTAIAFTIAALGAWSILSFVGALSGEGPAALVTGFISAVTGR